MRQATWRAARGLRGVVIVALLAALAAGLPGCGLLGMSAEEVELLDAATADAAFVSRSWADLGDDERREFVGQNALRWRYFNNLAHGRRPVAEEGGTP